MAANMQTNSSQLGGPSSSSSEANPVPTNPPLPLGKQHLVNLLDAEGGGGTIHWTEPHHREIAINARLEEFQQQAINATPSCEASNQALPLDQWPELSQELAYMMEDVDEGHDVQHDDDDDVQARHPDALAIDSRRRGPL